MRSFAVLSLAVAAAAQTGTGIVGTAVGTGTVGTVGYPTATGSSSAVPPVYTTYPAAGNTHKASGAALAVVGAVAAYLL